MQRVVKLVGGEDGRRNLLCQSSLVVNGVFLSYHVKDCRGLGVPRLVEGCIEQRVVKLVGGEDGRRNSFHSGIKH